MIYPETSTTFIDRFLAGAEAYRVPVIIVFNKCDLLTEEELRYEKMMRTLYETIGYQCVEISAATGEGVDELRPLIRDKKSLLIFYRRLRRVNGRWPESDPHPAAV